LNGDLKFVTSAAPPGESVTGIMSAQKPRPVFAITLRPEPGTDAIRSLRRALKMLLRFCGLRVIKIKEQKDAATE
jgi:hypothetical protein